MMPSTATKIDDYNNLVRSLKSLSGADLPRYRHVPSNIDPDEEFTSQTISNLNNLNKEALFRCAEPISLGQEKTSFHFHLESISRGQRLFHYIEKARQSGEITFQTASLAWNAWNAVSKALSKTLSVPDASYGPDGQFLFLWDKGEHHLELEIEPSGTGYFFYRNRTSGAFWDSDYKVGDTLTPGIIEKLRIFA